MAKPILRSPLRCGCEVRDLACNLLTLTLTLLLSQSLIAQPQQEKKPEQRPVVREIFVPFEELQTILQSDARRVFMTRQEYDQLVKDAVKQRPNEPPHAASITSAEYRIDLQDGRALVTADLAIEVLKPGRVSISLPVAGVGVRTAMLDGKSAPLARAANGASLLVEGQGTHKLSLAMTTAVQTEAAEQTLALELPRGASSKVTLVAPGNIEVKDGAEVISRRVDPATGKTYFDLVAWTGVRRITLSMNNRRLRDDQAVVCRSVIVDELTQAYERLHITSSFEVMHGAIDEVRFRAPKGWEISEVRGELLARWSVSEEDDSQIIQVSLREPVRTDLAINVLATRTRPDLESWSLAKWTPLDTVGNVAVVGLLLEERLKTEAIESAEVLPIDNEVLVQALPESLLSFEPGQPKIRPAFAYYAPQGDYQLSGRIVKPPARLESVSNLLITGSNEQLQVDGVIVLAPSVERRFHVEITSPSDWRITSITDENQKPIPFEALPGDDDARTRWKLELPNALAPGSQFALLLQARPDNSDWLGAWQEKTVSTPRFEVVGADEQRGSLAVQVRDDLSVQPAETTGLETLDNREALERFGDASAALAYRFTGEYTASLLFKRQQPYVSGRTYAFLKVQPNQLMTRFELQYTVQQARVRQLRFALPLDTPQVISIAGVRGLQLKGFYSEEVDDERIWTAELPEPLEGVLSLAVQFEQNWEGDPEPTTDPSLARLLDVSYQTTVIAVEGDPRLDVEIASDARGVDIGELAAAEYVPGSRLLGAYEFIGPAGRFQLNLERRAGRNIPTAIIERADMLTMVSPNGRCQTVAYFHLNTKATFLEMRLPTDAKLWSVLVDDQPVTPQRNGQQLLISLPTAPQTRRLLQVAFETAISAFDGFGRFDVAGPLLYVRADEGDAGEPIPTADIEWRILPPPGYQLTKAQGAVFRASAKPWAPGNWLRQVGRLMGSAADSMMPQSAMPMATSARTEMIDMYEDESALFDEMPMEESAATEAPPGMELGGMAGGIGGIGGGGFGGGMGGDGAPAPADMPNAPASGEGAPGGEGAFRREAEKFESGSRNGTILPQNSLPIPQSAATATPQPPGAGQFAADEELLESLVQAPANDPNAANFDDWGLTGLRSLPIDFQQTLAQSSETESVLFRGLGAAPEFSGELVSQQRLDALAWSWGLLVFAFGVALTRASVNVKIRLIVLTATVSVIAPLLVNEIDLLGPLGFCSFVAALALVVYYPLAAFFTWFASAGQRFFAVNTNSVAAGLLLLSVLGLALPSGAEAQERNVDWDALLNRLSNTEPVKIPKNAVIIPYRLGEDGNVRESIKQAEKVLVPYETYVNLWNRARPDQPISGPAPEREFIFAGAEYEATLGLEDQLLIRGRINVDVLTDQPVMAPLRLEGGVLSEALVDGRPARLSTIGPAAGAGQAKQAAKPMLAVLLSGEGRKQIQLTIRLTAERQGGWQRVQVRLPGVVSGAITLHVPKQGTEVRLRGVHDRELFETTQDAETIATALDLNQPLGVQWRPKVGETQIDRTLTAQSTAVWDVQDEGLRLNWNIQLAFRQGRRDAFTLHAPRDYLVEQVSGDNIRSWRAEKEDDHQRIEVTLLKAVAGRVNFTLRMSKRGQIADDQEPLVAPVVTAADAALHQGAVYIRRSPVIELRVVQQRGVAQTDINDQAIRLVANQNSAGESPLGVVNFQAFRFTSTDYAVQVQADPVTADDFRLRANWQTLLHLGGFETRLESLVKIDAGHFTMHHVQLQVPAELQIDRVEADQLLDWAASVDGETQQLDIFFQSGQRGQFAIVLVGEIPGQPLSNPLELPRLQLPDADRQTGQIVVKSDTGYEIQPRQLTNVQASPVRGPSSPALRQVQSWLTPENRSAAQWVLSVSDHANYGGRLVAETRSPRVSATSVTNVRVTDQTIEESLLLRYQVSNAGLRQIGFRLPSSLREARIQAPLVRRQILQDIEGDDSQFRVVLELQEAVLGEIVVVVEHDRLHDGGRHAAPIPVFESDVVDTVQQYVTLENASRDELVIVTQRGVEPLGRRTPPAELSGVNLNRALAVRDNPLLEYEAKQRTIVSTAGARIELAESSLAVDAAGVYRGQQVYHIDNRTEQFLEVELPATARLWTAIVANEPVKPAKSDQGERFVRIPLVKTAVGDPNYTIRLQYGGQLENVEWRQVEFPLIRTVNVNVELSQVRLFLPESNHWGRFGGSMREVKDERTFIRGYAGYVNRQISKATKALTSKDAYRRARAKNNLKQLALAVETFQAENRGRRDVQAEFDGNMAALKEAEEQAEAIEATPENLGDNRGHFQELFDMQTNDFQGKRGEYSYNFGKSAIQDNKESTKGGQGFDEGWLLRNNLSGKPSKPMDELRKQRIVNDTSRPEKIDQLASRGKALSKKLSSQLDAPQEEKPSQRSSAIRSNQELAERYSRRLERDGQRGGGRFEGRNRRSGEQQSEQGQSGQARGYQAQDQSMQMQESMNSDAYGDSNGNGQRGPTGNTLNAPRVAAFNQDGSPPFSFGLDGDVSGEGQPVIVDVAGRMASLDVNLPMRGVEYRFTTPRGDQKITGYGVSRSFVWRMSAIASVVGVLIGWLVFQRVARKLIQMVA